MTKLAGEHLCLLYLVNHGVPTVALRYFTVYGPRQRPDMGFHRFLTAAHHGEPITVYGDGEQTRDFTFVGDVGRGDAPGGPSRACPAASTTSAAARASRSTTCCGSSSRSSDGPLSIDRDAPQKGDMRDTFADTSLARADLGFAPKTSLAEGLAAEYAWLKPQLDVPTPRPHHR